MERRTRFHCERGTLCHPGSKETWRISGAPSVPVPDGENSPQWAAFCLQIRGLRPSESISTGGYLGLTDLTERHITKVLCRKHRVQRISFFTSRWKSAISIFGLNVNVEHIQSVTRLKRVEPLSSKGQLIKFARSRTIQMKHLGLTFYSDSMVNLLAHSAEA